MNLFTINFFSKNRSQRILVSQNIIYNVPTLKQKILKNSLHLLPISNNLKLIKNNIHKYYIIKIIIKIIIIMIFFYGSMASLSRGSEGIFTINNLFWGRIFDHIDREFLKSFLERIIFKFVYSIQNKVNNPIFI